MQSLMAIKSNCFHLSLKFLAFGLLFSSIIIANAQEVDTIYQGDLTDFSVDVLGNLYIIEHQDSLHKFVADPLSNSKNYYYSNASLGDINRLDVTNPMKILVSYADFATIIMLDVTLRETDRIYLPDIQVFSSPVAFCMGYDQSIWIFDDQEISLLRVSFEGQRTFESQSLIQMIGFVPVIESMQFLGQYLVLHDEEKGFLVFDQFGGFIKFIPQPDVDSWQLTEQSIVYLTEGSIFNYPLTSFAKTKLGDLPKEVKKFQVRRDKLYYQTSKAVVLQPLTTD